MDHSNFTIEPDVPAGAIDAMLSGLQQLGLGAVPVSIPNDFTATVQKLTGHTSYDVDRGSGTVGAKTIVAKDGTSLILVNWAAAMELPNGELRRLLAHEACHVAMHNREEWMDPFINVDASPSEQGMVQLAFVAIEEYRAELALYEKDFEESAATSGSHLDDALFNYLGDVVLATSYGDNPGEMHQIISKAVDSFTKPLAYLSAVEVVSGEPAQDRVPVVAQESWYELVDPLWADWIAACQALPSALWPLGNEAAQKSVSGLAGVMRSLFGCAGFEYVDTNEGGLAIYSTQANLAFDTRFARYKAQAELGPTEAE